MRCTSWIAVSPLLLHVSLGQFTTATRSRSAQGSASVIATSSVAIVTPSGSGLPCAQVSALQRSYFAENPSGTLGPFIPASLANACASSVPIVSRDATDLIDGLLAMLQFQSTLDFLDNPPAGHPIAGVDLVKGMNAIRSKVTSGQYSSEIAFETELVTLLASAHDGHLAFYPDAMTVFRFGQSFGSLVSISRDGKAVPELFLYNEMRPYLSGATSVRPSAVQQINGVDAAQFISQQGLNSTFQGFQDADAAYNSFLWSPNAGEGARNNPGVFSGFALSVVGDDTSIRFANGSSVERANYAIPLQDFSGVRDGQTFYDTFCNAANKPRLLSRRTEPTLEDLYQQWKKGEYWQHSEAKKTVRRDSEHTIDELYETWQSGRYWQHSKADKVVRRQSSSAPLAGYPKPEVISSDGSIAGFFLSEAGYDNTAVLLVRSFSIEDQKGFQDTLTSFLDLCRSEGKQGLIIDMTGNPGGVVGLGYELFKQLFPTLDPWGASNFRAHQGYRLLGETITTYSSNVLRTNPNNYRAFERAFGTTPFAAETKLNTNGTNFANFADFYGPVQAANSQGSYTKTFRLDIDNPDFSEAFAGIVISGYDASNPLGPQPFQPENMVILTDGQCSSTCAAASHLLKWQGKVKSVAIGGRPQTGPMQAVGGVKGSQVQTFLQLFAIAYASYTISDSATRRSWSGTVLDTIIRNGEYVLQRTRSGGETPSELSFNVQNNIAEGDRSLTPTQFVYEAADCRLFYQEQHIRDVSTTWPTVAAQAFGLNGVSKFSGCVDGSTNQTSSLSGNAALYNNGQPTNATTETRDYGVANGGKDHNAASRTLGSTWLLLLAGTVGAYIMTM